MSDKNEQPGFGQPGWNQGEPESLNDQLKSLSYYEHEKLNYLSKYIRKLPIIIVIFKQIS
jgi:hypothetical protein